MWSYVDGQEEYKGTDGYDRFAGTPEWGCIMGHCPPALGKGRAMGAQVPLHTIIISNFMIYQDQFKANLFQLFAHT